MKRRQYEGASYSDEFWLAKLGEEFGEVAREVVDNLKADEPPINRGKLVKELEHVEFIARCFREDVQRRGF